MRLTKIRVRKYRNIQDSGDVELLENLTCVVGKNQSGKTALLRALHKFNSREKNVVYDMARDWPRGERRDKDPKQIVCEATFALNDVEKASLAELTPVGLFDAPQVLVTRNYAGEFEVEVPSRPEVAPHRLHPNVVDELCQALPCPYWKFNPGRYLSIYENSYRVEAMN